MKVLHLTQMFVPIKSIINILELCIILFFSVTFLEGKDLSSQYKQMMNSVTAEKETVSKNIQENSFQGTPKIIEYNLIDEIKKVQALKQDTFESSSDFKAKREQALNELRNKVKFFSKNSSEEYSAGAVSMKSYDADREVMQLTSNWNSGVRSVFPEIKNLQTLFLNIDKHNARALFEKQKKHYFHIDMKYTNSKLTIFEMSIYNKYKMFKPKGKPTSKNVSLKNTTAQKEVAKSHEKHKVQMSFHENVEILNIYHPKKEPKGLFIVKLYNNFLDRKQIYRVYCPSKMVRDITGGRGKWKKARKAPDEDRIRNNNKQVARKAYDRACR